MRLQERIETLEGEARGRLLQALEAGNEKLMDLDRALARLASDGWSVATVRRQMDELRARAEELRASAVKRAGELPARAVTQLATRGRRPVQGLAKELQAVAKRLERPPTKPTVVKAVPAEAEAEAAPASAKAS